GRLSCLYELPASLRLTEPRILVSVAIVAIVATVAVIMRKRWPALAAALVVYAVVLSPVLGVLQSGIQIVADRYSYLAQIGLCIAIAGGLAGLAQGPRRWAGAA